MNDTGEQAWEVEQVVDMRMRRYGRSKKEEREYLVLWKDYGEWEKTWEPENNLRGAEQKIQEFLINRAQRVLRSKNRQRKNEN